MQGLRMLGAAFRGTRYEAVQLLQGEIRVRSNVWLLRYPAVGGHSKAILQPAL